MGVMEHNFAPHKKIIFQMGLFPFEKSRKKASNAGLENWFPQIFSKKYLAEIDRIYDGTNEMLFRIQ